MRAREWKQLIEAERDRMRAEAEHKTEDGERYLKMTKAQARILVESADALDRVLEAAKSEDAEDPEPVEDAKPDPAELF